MKEYRLCAGCRFCRRISIAPHLENSPATRRLLDTDFANGDKHARTSGSVSSIPIAPESIMGGIDPQWSWRGGPFCPFAASHQMVRQMNAGTRPLWCPASLDSIARTWATSNTVCSQTEGAAAADVEAGQLSHSVCCHLLLRRYQKRPV